MTLCFPQFPSPSVQAHRAGVTSVTRGSLTEWTGVVSLAWVKLVPCSSLRPLLVVLASLHFCLLVLNIGKIVSADKLTLSIHEMKREVLRAAHIQIH